MKTYFIILLVILSQLNAKVCSNSEFDKAEYFAEQTIKNYLTNKYGAAENLVVDIDSCKFNSYSKQYKLKTNIKWRGYIRTWVKYQIDGTLKLNQDGSNPNLAVEWINQNLKDYHETMGWITGIVGTIILLEQNNRR